MKKKVLIIDDNPSQYYLIKDWIASIGYREENIIPIDRDVSQMESDSTSDDAICEFVEKQIKDNYEDIILILCDIRFIRDNDRGITIIKHIREKIRGLSPSNWTALVPIIGMTSYASEINLNNTYTAGADYAFEKAFVLDKKMESENIKKIIKAQANKFEKFLESIYPPELKNNIIDFKNKNAKKTAFIIVDFRHKSSAETVQEVLLEYEINGFIADAPGGENSEDTWKNIQLYMHGCDFGISIFADDSTPISNREEKRNRINPNVCIEAGYMRGLQKDVFYLKDRSLDKNDLPSDFRGKLYTDFNDDHSLKVNLKRLLKNRGWIK